MSIRISREPCDALMDLAAAKMWRWRRAGGGRKRREGVKERRGEGRGGGKQNSKGVGGGKVYKRLSAEERHREAQHD